MRFTTVVGCVAAVNSRAQTHIVQSPVASNTQPTPVVGPQTLTAPLISDSHSSLPRSSVHSTRLTNATV